MTPTLLTLPPDSTIAPDKPHIILVGLPGSGKSSLGRRLARRLGRPFLDFDVEIERREGRSVQQIFAEEGEAYFRARELDLTHEVAGVGGMVLAPGGGWIAIPGALALLRPPGRMIYLKVRPDVAYKRIASGRRIRPLVAAEDPIGTLRRLLAEREPKYLAADHVVETDVIAWQRLTDTLVQLAGA